jgi:hypothetical protein
MGGSRSTRWGSHWKRLTVEDCAVLDASRWTRTGVLTIPPRWRAGSFGYHVEDWDAQMIWLHYTLGLSNERIEYAIAMTPTRPHFGGLRWWFLCPTPKSRGRDVQPCGRRVGKLYLPPRARQFACRVCHNLTYQSSQASDSRLSWFRRNEEAVMMMLETGGVDSLSETQRRLLANSMR